jgi:hypothetical protein
MLVCVGASVLSFKIFNSSSTNYYHQQKSVRTLGNAAPALSDFLVNSLVCRAKIKKKACRRKSHCISNAFAGNMSDGYLSIQI